MAGGEKTEAPTPRHREEVRRRGSIPKSAELTSVLGLLAGVLALRSIGLSMLTQTGELMGSSFRNLATADWTVSSIASYGNGVGMLYLNIMMPLFVTVVIVGVASNLLQSGVLLTGKPISPDFSRISPIKGFQRLFSPRSLVEFAKSVAKIGIVGYVVYQTLQDKYLQIVALSGSDLHGALGAIAGVALEVLFKAGFALLGLAALDYGYQRWEYEKNIRMTKEQVKEEFRQSEGDPKIRGKIRQQQRKMAGQRMMHDVKVADVVLTNPTHLAVALQYRPELMRSPKVLAKGQRLIAQKIKEEARQHGVPVIENKPLAQALYKTVEVGAEVPPVLYHAVAEILAFVYSLKRHRTQGGHRVAS